MKRCFCKKKRERQPTMAEKPKQVLQSWFSTFCVALGLFWLLYHWRRNRHGRWPEQRHTDLGIMWELFNLTKLGRNPSHSPGITAPPYCKPLLITDWDSDGAGPDPTGVSSHVFAREAAQDLCQDAKAWLYTSPSSWGLQVGPPSSWSPM